MAEYRVVYFATHGLVAGDVQGLAEPSLALTLLKEPSDFDDGLLTASELAASAALTSSTSATSPRRTSWASPMASCARYSANPIIGLPQFADTTKAPSRERRSSRVRGTTEEFGGPGRMEQHSVGHEGDVIGDLACKTHFVGDDNHCDPGVRQLALLDHLRVQRGCGFIEQQNFGLHRQCPRDRSPLLLAARNLAGVLVRFRSFRLIVGKDKSFVGRTRSWSVLVQVLASPESSVGFIVRGGLLLSRNALPIANNGMLPVHRRRKRLCRRSVWSC